MEADQLGRLRDILEAARPHRQLPQQNYGSRFRDDTQKQDAVIRRIEIIGEAASHLSETTRQAVPQLPFRKMRGMRNIMTHNYANVDLNIVWQVATVHVAEARAALEKFFSAHM